MKNEKYEKIKKVSVFSDQLSLLKGTELNVCLGTFLNILISNLCSRVMRSVEGGGLFM